MSEISLEFGKRYKFRIINPGNIELCHNFVGYSNHILCRLWDYDTKEYVSVYYYGECIIATFSNIERSYTSGVEYLDISIKDIEFYG